MKRILTLALISLVAFAFEASAQKVAVKTNSLYWMTATPNVGFEVALADRWTFELAGGYNPWTYNKEENVKAKHFLVTPEVRYWFCESFQGHFLGANGNYSQYNVSGVNIPKVFLSLSSDSSDQQNSQDSQDVRKQGWATGLGITYGYATPIARRWNIELTLGLGLWYTEYDRFESRPCGLFQESVQKHLIGPTALGVSFIYMIK